MHTLREKTVQKKKKQQQKSVSQNHTYTLYDIIYNYIL